MLSIQPKARSIYRGKLTADSIPLVLFINQDKISFPFEVLEIIIGWIQVVKDLEEGGDVLLAPGDGQGHGLLLRGLLGQQHWLLKVNGRFKHFFVYFFQSCNKIKKYNIMDTKIIFFFYLPLLYASAPTRTMNQ